MDSQKAALFSTGKRAGGACALALVVLPLSGNAQHHTKTHTAADLEGNASKQVANTSQIPNRTRLRLKRRIVIISGHPPFPRCAFIDFFVFFAAIVVFAAFVFATVIFATVVDGASHDNGELQQGRQPGGRARDLRGGKGETYDCAAARKEEERRSSSRRERGRPRGEEWGNWALPEPEAAPRWGPPAAIPISSSCQPSRSR